MQQAEPNLDANLVIQSFQERINQMLADLVIKDAVIKHLNNQIQELNSHLHTLQVKDKKQKEKKETTDDFE